LFNEDERAQAPKEELVEKAGRGAPRRSLGEGEPQRKNTKHPEGGTYKYAPSQLTCKLARWRGGLSAHPTLQKTKPPQRPIDQGSKKKTGANLGFEGVNKPPHDHGDTLDLYMGANVWYQPGAPHHTHVHMRLPGMWGGYKGVTKHQLNGSRGCKEGKRGREVLKIYTPQPDKFSSRCHNKKKRHNFSQ